MAPVWEPPRVPEELVNPWPVEWENAFRERARRAIDAFGPRSTGIGLGADGDLQGYARAMMGTLAGRGTNALRVLEAADPEAQTDHRHTFGIDFYDSLLLRHQVRKAFLFGPWLEAEYLERMLRGARIWTAEDPLGRAHPLHGNGDPRRAGWGPESKGGWVDGRDADPLRASRDVAIYLFAEATGNERTRGLARDRLAALVRMFYHAGMREWDSPGTLPQTLSAWHNLHDFARDPEVRWLGKAALDWLYAGAALGYWRGSFAGPGLRTGAGTTVPGGGSAAPLLALMFGDAPEAGEVMNRDALYLATSAYRAPRAVVELARKNFTRPVEIFASKPPYELWVTNRSFAPRYWETRYFGRTFELTTVASAGGEAAWNPSVFRLLTYDTRHGAVQFGLDTAPPWEASVKRPGDQLGQYRNLAVWLRPGGTNTAFHLQLPREIEPLVVSNVWFLTFERTWVAVRGIGLGPWEPLPVEGKAATTFAGERFYRASATGTNVVGVALEVGEATSYSAFQRDVLEKGSLDLDGLERGEVELRGSDGRRLRVRHNPKSDLPFVERDGRRHEWGRHLAVYEPVNARGPISQSWLGGTLRVEAGGEWFQQSVTRDGVVVHR